jgi:hypothetical protein
MVTANKRDVVAARLETGDMVTANKRDVMAAR